MVNPLAEELQRGRRAAPCSLVIFGATGDLTHRKLVPALAGLKRDGLLPAGFAVVGFARREKTDEQFREELAAGVAEHGRTGAGEGFDALRESIFYHRSSFEDGDGYAALGRRLEAVERELGTTGNRMLYLATPPSAYSGILANLRDAGLSLESSDRFARVVVEKPFGHDLESARALNAQVGAAFAEDQVYRIDHYLGKETVQNILAMRFANGIFEPLWNGNFIDHVQITVAESIGVEGRGAYFEEAGVLRDMIQNHLLQVLTLVAMEPPVSLASNHVRDEKVKVLHAIRSFAPHEVAENTVRGRYTKDFVGGVEVPGYLDEPGVSSDSNTETYAAVRLEIHNWRWGGTPFFLRSGKRLPRRVSEIAIHFKRPPHHLFANNDLSPNILLLRIQPDEGISLRFGSKVPGPDVNIRDVRMDFRYGSAFGRESADAYERLLLDAMLGDSTLFARRDEVEEAWRIVDSIHAGWRDFHPRGYGAGTWGPEQADRLLGAGRVWRRP
ncbi:MAG: glucose-6-phosphate dehydrogenase [Planctomycetes bacterium]|nr:glucose-6-phosphate dehydrogenase [Planctomycetota bacterium]